MNAKILVVAALLTPSLSFAAERTTLKSLFPELTPAGAQMRAAMIDASWDAPMEVLERIQGVARTDEERLDDDGLASLINPANANLQIGFTDLRLGSAGPDVEVERTFNSLETATGEFGRGWSWAYGVRLQKTGDSVEVHEADGATITFAESSKGNWAAPSVGQELVFDGRGWRRSSKEAAESERYDARGFLVEREDATGRKLVLRRDANGFLLAIVAANGREIRVKTNKAGRIVSMTDPAGRVATYEYQSDRLVSSTVDGLVTTYAWDAEQALTQVTFPSGKHLNFRYNEGGMIRDVQMGDQLVKASFAFSAEQPELHGATIQEGSDSTRFSYDEKEGTARFVYPDGSQETRRFDPACGCIKESKTAEDTGRFVYDDSGRVSEMSGADGTYRYTYGPRAMKTMEVRGTDPAASMKLTFDDSGNMIRSEAPGSVVEYAYENGLVSKVTENGVVGQMLEHNALGDISAVRNARGQVARFEYDAAGMVTSIARGDYLKLEFEHRAGSFTPKTSLTLKGRAAELPASELEFLFGEAATSVPVKKASLDSIGGPKFASLAGAPLASGGLTVYCYGKACARARITRCLAALVVNTASPIGTPFTYNNRTGEFDFDVGGWVKGHAEDELKDAIKEAGKKQVKRGWLKNAIHNVGKFGKGLVKKAGKVAWKVAKAVARPVQYVLALKSGYECFRDANAGAKKWGCRSDASFDLPPPRFFFLREWPV